MTDLFSLPLPKMKDPLMIWLRERFEEHYSNLGPEIKNTYREDDWRRLEYVANMISQTGSVLDIGVGPGALLNYLTLSGKYSCVTGIDKHPFTKYYEPKMALDRRIMRVENMDFADNSFDTVICMEVIEHLSLSTMDKAITQLKRICKKHLIITVPYNERIPLSRYHTKQFTEEVISSMFPEFSLSLLVKSMNPDVSWALLQAEY
jgi:2-polyprenyl-3-methyl-5-hydroxy-6-metoxy-1,4-benzoquinol methylase